MARLARGEVFNPREVSVFHCINRCVRRCFLCGADPVTGIDYEHRKAWVEQRIRFLAGCFAVDVLGFAVLSNHFHIVLRNRPDIVDGWSDTEVACRWCMLCPARKTADGDPEPPNGAEMDAIRNDPARLAEIRLRLSHISWFMRMIAEPIARRANAEENCPGRFWQGRFRSVKLCDDAAILACCIYVDLNLVRAGCCETPEEAEHTSARRRIEQRQAEDEVHAAAAPLADHGTVSVPSPDVCPGAADWLAPLELDERAQPGPQPSVLPTRASDKGFLPMSLEDYLDLLDWTGQQTISGKRGVIPGHLAPILDRLNIPESGWLKLATDFGRVFCRVAGCPASVAREARSCPNRRRFNLPGGRLFRRVITAMMVD